MTGIRITLSLLLALSSGAAVGQGLPFLDYLEEPTVTVSGRLTVRGTNLEQTGQIHVCGLEALVIPIPGTNSIEMDAYVPENTPFGPCEVTATTSAGVSNPLTVEVTPRVPNGRILWRFYMNGQTMVHRPAIGEDETIYAKSSAGDLVSLTPEGELQWLLQVGPDWTPTIDVGPDGTIYTAEGGPSVVAVNPDGTIKWSYADPIPSQGVLAGPNVGPDGNIYVVTHIPGTGAFSLDPSGNLRWTGPDSPYNPIGQIGQEIVFNESQIFFCLDGLFDSFDFAGNHIFRESTITAFSSGSPQTAVGPNGDAYVEEWGRLRSHAPSGALNWIAFDVGGTHLWFPDVGPDGTIYVHRNVFNTVHAVNPDGSEKWTFSHEESTISPVVNPAGDTLVMGGSNISGLIVALDATNGTQLWELDLGSDQYGFNTPQGRPRFSNDGSVAYFMVLGPAGYPGHSYVYAIQVEPIAVLGHALPGAGGEPVLRATGSLEPGSPVSFSLSQAPPNARVSLVIGRSAAATEFRGGIMLPARNKVIRLETDAAGELLYNMNWPGSWPSGSTLYVQAWIQDPSGPQGMSASNALSLISP